jgi:hypothetical protein
LGDIHILSIYVSYIRANQNTAVELKKELKCEELGGEWTHRAIHRPSVLKGFSV